MFSLENFQEIEVNFLVLGNILQKKSSTITIFLSKHKKTVLLHFYAISFDQKSVLSYLSISTLSSVQYRYCLYIVYSIQIKLFLFI